MPQPCAASSPMCRRSLRGLWGRRRLFRSSARPSLARRAAATFRTPLSSRTSCQASALYKHRFKDEEPAYFQLKHGKGRKSNLTDRAAANLLREYELVKAGALPGTCADVLEHYQTTKATISRLNKKLKATGTTDSRKKGTSAASFWSLQRPLRVAQRLRRRHARERRSFGSVRGVRAPRRQAPWAPSGD